MPPKQRYWFWFLQEFFFLPFFLLNDSTRLNSCNHVQCHYEFAITTLCDFSVMMFCTINHLNRDFEKLAIVVI